VIEDLIELRPAPDAKTAFTDYVTLEWARDFPAEQIWKVRKERDVTKAIAALVAICALVAAAVFRGSPPVVVRNPRPNVLLVLTDDQTLDTIASDPPAMPWLQSQLADPERPLAVVPTRGRLDAAVLSVAFDDPYRPLRHPDRRAHQRRRPEPRRTRNTLPVWLHDAGSHHRPGREVPELLPVGTRPVHARRGGDRWFAKENADESTAYYDYEVVRPGDRAALRRRRRSDYATDRARRAGAPGSCRTAPAEQPWFFVFQPERPHLPWGPVAGACRRVRRFSIRRSRISRR
jgi:hypothetical protein